MPTAKHWEIIPADDFSDRDSWRSLGKNRFAALRIRVLIVQTSGEPARLGPAIEEHNIPAKATFKLRLTRKKVVSRADSFSTAIGLISTRRIADKLSEKLRSELSTKLPGFNGKAAAETVSVSEVEISEEIERSLTTATSHTVEDSEERENEIGIPAEPGARTAQIRLRYLPHRWDVFLNSFEYLELSYRKRWLWKQVRETIKRTSSGPLGRPLKSLTFYQPQATVDFTLGPVANTLDEPDAVEVAALTTPMPASVPPALPDLESLAKLAFPVTKPEKERAAARKAGTVDAFGLAPLARRSRAGRASAKKKAMTRKKTLRYPSASPKANAKKSARKPGSAKRPSAKARRVNAKRSKRTRRR